MKRDNSTAKIGAKESLTSDDDDDSRGYITLNPSTSASQISSTDTIYVGELCTSPIDFKQLQKEFRLNRSRPTSCDPFSSLSSDGGSNSSLNSIFSYSKENIQGYPVISKINPVLVPQSPLSLTTSKSFSTKSLSSPTLSPTPSPSLFSTLSSAARLSSSNASLSTTSSSSSSLSSITSDLPAKQYSTRLRSWPSSASSLSFSSSITSEPPKQTSNNLTVNSNPKSLSSDDYDSDGSITSQLPKASSSKSLPSVLSVLPPKQQSTRRPTTSRFSSSSSVVPSSSPITSELLKRINGDYNLTIIPDPKPLSYDVYDSDGSITSQPPSIRKVYPSPSVKLPLWSSSSTVGSYSDNQLSLREAEKVYESIKPEYIIKGHKTDSETSMQRTQTESHIFPLAEGQSPTISGQSFDGLSFRSPSSTSLTSLRSEAIFPKAKLIENSDEISFFSSTSATSDGSIFTDIRSSDLSECGCLTAESLHLDSNNDECKSDISDDSEVVENALQSSPKKLEIESDKCSIFYLENHCAEELLIALDTVHGIDCCPTDFIIEGWKKKKIVVSARKSMLPGTRNKIRATFKVNNNVYRLNIPFSIV